MRALILIDIQNGLTKKKTLYKDAQIKIITTENKLSKQGILIQEIDNINSN